MIINHTAKITGAYLRNHRVAASDVPGMISAVVKALEGLSAEPVAVPSVVHRQTAYRIAKSITPDHLYSFEDGKPYRTLKRVLARQGMTPQQYRDKYGLPNDYPMVAPNYSAFRSEWAKKSGLGKSTRGSRKGSR